MPVTCPANGKYVKEFTINALEIVELVEAASENAPPAAPPKPIPQVKTFEDPAILSMGKRPPAANTNRIPLPSQWTNMERADSSRTVTSREGRSVNETYHPVEAIPTLVEPMQQAHIAEVEADAVSAISVPEVVVLEELEAEAEVSPEQPAAKPAPAKRTRRRKANQRAVIVGDSTLGPDATPVKTKETTRSQRGWRQTPLLEPNPSFQPFTTLKRRGKRGAREQQNGWGTEDATDVQEMGDFDFADNLAKFDKQGVFNQLLAEDGTADEDRLVSHNRLSRAKPGTNSGRNLAYNENVLESTPNGAPKMRTEMWKSEESDTDNLAFQRDAGSGRASRRAESKMPANRRATSRKGSSTTSAAHPQTQIPARTLSVRISCESLS